jgi:hypothetical protein
MDIFIRAFSMELILNNMDIRMNCLCIHFLLLIHEFLMLLMHSLKYLEFPMIDCNFYPHMQS